MPTREQVTKLVGALKAQEDFIENLSGAIKDHEWANPFWMFAQEALDAIDPDGIIYWYCYENSFGTGGMTIDDKLVETVEELCEVIDI